MTRSFGSAWGLILSLLVGFAQADEKKTTAFDPKMIDAQVAVIDRVYRRLLKETAQARNENDVARLNCLIEKLDQVKGYRRASDRIKRVVTQAKSTGDQATIASYGSRVVKYSEISLEIEESIKDCTGDRIKEGDPTLVYIRPEGDSPLSENDSSPFEPEGLSGSLDYPAIPPASPFR